MIRLSKLLAFSVGVRSFKLPKRWAVQLPTESNAATPPGPSGTLRESLPDVLQQPLSQSLQVPDMIRLLIAPKLSHLSHISALQSFG